MAEVMICPMGSISKKAIRALEAAGVAVVETDDPSRVKFIRASEVVSSTDMLWAAMKSLNDNGYTSGREQFTKLLFTLIDSDRKARIEAAPSLTPPHQRDE